jgi:hypothetical protein
MPLAGSFRNLSLCEWQRLQTVIRVLDLGAELFILIGSPHLVDSLHKPFINR